MAIVRALKTGVWSDTTVWNTGALPTSSDDVYSNTFTVTIDTSPTVLSISNASATGVTAGGGFAAVNGITLTLTGLGVVAGGAASSTCFTSNLASGNSCTITGNITGGSANTSIGAINSSTGTLTIVGNVTGGSGAGSTGITNSSTGTVNITGTCTGGSQGTAHAINNTGSGTFNATGSCNGGTHVTATVYGASNSGAGTINITGACVAGSGTNAYALLNASTGSINQTGSLTPGASAAAVGPGSTTQVTILSGPFLTIASGINPVNAIRWFWANSNVTPTYYQIRTANLATIRPLYTADSVGGNPAVGNVRSGTVYGPASELTGTCAVPGASSVLSGVAVDNTTGTATISAASIRSALGMASANLDTQLAAIPTTAAPTAAAIRTEMDSNSTKLANLDATVSSRSTYAGADTSGTTTLLSRLTSTRAGYLDNLSTAPPSASTIATAVWAAGTRTLTTTIASASDVASAVWSAVTRTITGGTVDTLTNAPSVPTPAEISAEVWSTTTREITGGTVDTVTNSSPVDNEAIATAVRSELAPELAHLDADVSSRQQELERLGNVATTQEVGDIVEEAMQP